MATMNVKALNVTLFNNTSSLSQPPRRVLSYFLPVYSHTESPMRPSLDSLT